MLSLRLAGAKVGNTGAANEAVAISDELLRQGVLNRDEYKAIMSQIKL
jgi:polyhydroxyalkanoate synthesis regulator phasin